ncbi:MAG: hypothetical protein H3C62_06970 [Gemmatimonadaceae bacterium]|nr:hypothetical protein [Gemmatimonadaceae bacterium]
MAKPFDARSQLIGVARRFLLEGSSAPPAPAPSTDLPRLTAAALEKHRMSRSRERILANLDDMYREAFERAKATEDEAGMKALDFSYRREQLYFEILLDVRDALERR